tara:strand:+ start:156 stop:1412 length:1257 start_codon:yes stop_codon:yes gene_type:complete
MQLDDDLQTTLSKWPFILGDIILVATALAIAILGDWQLSTWQVVSCVISVALGAALFVLPYIVEFQVRLREEAEDRTADVRVLQRHIVSAQEKVEEMVERMETFEAGLSNLVNSQQPDAAVPTQALEERIDPLSKEQAEQSTQLKALSKQVESLAKSLNLKTDKNSAQVVKSLDPHIPAEEKVEEPKKLAPVEVTPDEPKTKKKRAPRKPRSPEPSLLQRAIEQKQDKSSEAVSRIIESKSKKSPPEEVPADEPTPEAPNTKTKKSVKVSKRKEPAAQTEELEVKTESAAEEEAPEPLDGVTVPSPEDETAEPEDMFGDVVPSLAKKRMRTKKSDSVVMVSVYIGIGNKPFVRGSGAGLNWDKGIAMEFVEIGKWKWIPPADFKEPVELQLFRNDEDVDSTGKYTLGPGQRLDISPVF